MDDHRFDDLARRFANGTSRRGLIKGMVGGLLGGLAGLGDTETRAARSPNGAACTRATQCASLKCVDGVCCNANCTGQCESCTTGTCRPAPAGTRKSGNRPACTGTAICQASCDGVTRTQCTSYPGLDIVCNDPVCEDGWETTYGCGGDGTCHPFSESCGLFVCNTAGTTCLDTCTTNTDCVGEAFCVNGVCQGDQPPGQPCSDPAQCQSGHCVDGVCCTSTCDDPCQACNVAGNLGFCFDVADGAVCDDGDACTTGDVCRTGNCHGTPVTCTTPALCQTDPGTCNPLTGACIYPNAPDNTTCGDGQVCCAGICCAAGQFCFEGICVTGTSCLGLDVFCDPNNNQCCQDEPTFCETTSTCHAANPGSNPTCCHRTGGFCTDTCDCCDFQLCRASKCCRLPEVQCTTDDQCCAGICCNGVCCNDFQACVEQVCQFRQD